MCIKWKAFVACNPAQDLTNVVQALEAIVNTCTNESSPVKWSIIITNAPVINSPASGSTNYATVATGWLEPKSYTIVKWVRVASNSGIVGETTG